MHITDFDMYHIDQDYSMSKIERISSDSEFDKLASVRMKLTLLKNTRPDQFLEISQIAQVTRAIYETYIIKYWKRVNNVVKCMHDHKAPVKIPKHDWNSLRITIYSDAAFHNNTELSSQLGRIVLLTDDNQISISVYYKSYKSRSIACSVLIAEVIAFEELFEDILEIRK